MLNGFSYHVTPAGLLFHEALVEAGCSVLPAGPQNTALQAEYAQALGANAFVGIASHLKMLFDQQPALQIRLAMAGAEPHVAALRAQLLAEHGVRSFDMYGFAEAGVIAVSCAEAGNLHLDADALVEVVDPASGSRLPASAAGELVVSLDNPGFPLLRFATGDLVEIDAAPCACGRPGVLRCSAAPTRACGSRECCCTRASCGDFSIAPGSTPARWSSRAKPSAIASRSRCGPRVRRRLHRPMSGRPMSRGLDRPLDTASLAAAFRETCRLGADRIDVEPGLAAGSCTFDDRRRS